jgi:hypothetical protein
MLNKKKHIKLMENETKMINDIEYREAFHMKML